MIIIFFVIFLALILGVGLLSRRFSRGTTDDYLLASGNVSVLQTTLSALASDYSGFMYVGLIGYVYTTGVSGIWLMVFWLIGEYFMMRYMPQKISEATKKNGLSTYSELVANYWGDNNQVLKKLAALVTLVFLSVYAAAQFEAAGKTLNVLFDWHLAAGAIITYIVVLAYCFAGGIRASIMTDSVQFAIMLASILVLVILSLWAIGGWSVFIDKLHLNPTEYTDFFPDKLGSNIFIAIFLFGWIAGGIGMSGQPHIAVRFMAMQNTTEYKKILWLYYGLAAVFTALCLLSALLAKVYFANVAIGDAETILPQLAIAVMPAILVGLLLSGILSAIISTADSHVLSCSAALGNDLLNPQKDDKTRLMQNKISTVLVATFALLVAVFAGKSVFTLVIFAWGGLASAFTPLLVLFFLGHKIPQNQAIIIMLSGLTASILWWYFGGNDITYEALIGIITGFIVFFVLKMLPLSKRYV